MSVSGLPSIHRLAVPRWLNTWSGVAGVVAVLARLTWLFERNFPSILLLELTGIVMAGVWRNYDSRQCDYLLRQLAVIDTSAAGIESTPIRWERNES